MNAAVAEDCTCGLLEPQREPYFSRRRDRRQGEPRQAAMNALALASGDKVLELHCGGGASLRAALRLVGAAGFAAGVDPNAGSVALSARALRHAVARGRAAVLRADLIDLPFRDRLFDKAFAVESYISWPQPERALREIARVLAPAGLLAITFDARGRAGEDGAEQAARAGALLKRLGWSLRAERAFIDAGRLRAVTLLAASPD